MFNEYIDNKKDEIVSQVCRLIQIPSVYEDSTDPTKPFGENTNKALEYALSLGEQLGFRIKNVDGYCGYIEFGEGEELVGIIGHLDVVPVGSGWTHDPFLGTVQNGNIYGRGAIDDKGPVIAALYAMKSVMDTCKVNKRVRLILGINEESDWKCIKYFPFVSFYYSDLVSILCSIISKISSSTSYPRPFSTVVSFVYSVDYLLMRI